MFCCIQFSRQLVVSGCTDWICYFGIRSYSLYTQEDDDLAKWKRYWCVLKNLQLSCWSAPDDVEVTAPLVTVQVTKVTVIVIFSMIFWDSDCGCQAQKHLPVLLKINGKNKETTWNKLLLLYEFGIFAFHRLQTLNKTSRDSVKSKNVSWQKLPRWCWGAGVVMRIQNSY